MGINLQKTFSKIFNSTWLLTIAMCMSLISCLPVQKETQCGENEAFNASRRQCVPVVGSSTSNTVFIGAKSPANSYSVSKSVVGATVHTVAVSDTFNYGFTVKWFVHASGATATTPSLVNSTNFSFFASVYPAGSYVIEAVLFDDTGINQLDSASWNVIVENLAAPSITSPSPAATAFTYFNSISTPQNLSATINSPDSEDGNYFIFLDGLQVASGPFSGVSTLINYAITPSALTNGLHTLEFKLHDGALGTTEFDSYTWLLNIVDPDFPVIQPVASDTNPLLTEAITIKDGTTFSSGGWTWNDLGTQTSLSSPGHQLCVQFDNVDKVVPLGSVDISVDYTVNGNVISTGSRVGLTNVFCADPLQLDAALTNFTLANPDVAESRTITVRTFEFGTSNLIESLSWNVVLRPRNIRPVISIDDTKMSPALGCTASSAVSYTSCTMTQSVNTNVDSNESTYNTVEGVTPVDTDNAQNFGIKIDFDPDIDLAAQTDYQVAFQLKPVGPGSWNNIDINAGVPDNAFTYSDCTYTAAETSASPGINDKLVCELRMDAFHNSGPILSGNYQLRAFITDANNGLGGLGNPPKESNIVTWDITVVEQQSPNSISIAAFDLVDASVDKQDYTFNGVTTANDTFTESWIEATSGGVCDPTPTGIPITTNLNEGTAYCIRTVVRDLERDNFGISMSMDNAVLGGTTTLSPTQIITRTDNREYSLVSTLVTIPEWTVLSTGTSNIYITVQDQPESFTPICTTCSSATLILNIGVNQTNPAPVFTTPGPIDQTGKFVFAGVPFTINVPLSDITDASIYDGANLQWKWQIDTGSGYVDLPNTTNSTQSLTTLVWTPDLAIANDTVVSLKLCVGDDGSPNQINATCAAPNVEKVFSNITIKSSAYYLTRTETNPSSGNELATWIDEARQPVDETMPVIKPKAKYTAYTTGTDIYVEKSVFDETQRVYVYEHSISFPSEDSGAGQSPVIADSLSIDGYFTSGDDTILTDDSGALVIGYRVLNSIAGVPQLRVRRINISKGKLNFNYCGMFTPDANGIHAAGVCDSSDLYDAAASDFNTTPSEITLSRNSSGQVTFSVTSIPTDGNIVLRANNGAIVTYDFLGGDSSAPLASTRAYCNAGCATEPLIAQSLANAINNTDAIPSTDPNIISIANEFFAEVSGTTITLYGPEEFDYYDEISASAAYLGNIKIRTDSWHLPYADVANSLKLAIAKGSGVTATLGLGSSPLTSNIQIAESGINIQEITQTSTATNFFVAAKNSTSDLDIYKLNADGTYAAEEKNIFAGASATGIVNDLSITTNFDDSKVLVSAINTSGGLRNLSLIKIDNNLTPGSVVVNDSVTALGHEHFVQNIDRAQVIADENELDTLYVALTTTLSSIPNPNNAYIIRLTQSGVANFDFHEYDYPKLNISSIVDNSAISASGLFNRSMFGHLNEASLVATPDASAALLYFGFHESVTGNKIRNGLYNTDQNGILTNSTAVSGSFPALIGN